MIVITELEVIGAVGGIDQLLVAAQHLVLVEVANLLQRIENFLIEAFGTTVFITLRSHHFGIKQTAEQRHQISGNLEVGSERIRNKILTEVTAQLLHVAGIQPQQGNHSPVQPGTDHKMVESIIFCLLGPDGFECLLEGISDQ